MKPCYFKPLFGIVALVLHFATVGAAHAIPITFSFTGKVDSVDPALTGTFAAGETLTGSYTFGEGLNVVHPKGRDPFHPLESVAGALIQPSLVCAPCSEHAEHNVQVLVAGRN